MKNIKRCDGNIVQLFFYKFSNIYYNVKTNNRNTQREEDSKISKTIKIILNQINLERTR